MTSIGEDAFSGCSSLTSIIIGNSVTSIGAHAFAGCEKLTDVYCYAEKIPSTWYDVFSNSPIEYATLHVPESAIEDYKKTFPWSRFGSITTLSGEVVEVEICATPSISYQDGKLTFACETEEAECVANIICDDAQEEFCGDEILLTATYQVNVYAKAEGLENSETATATLCWIECTENHDGEEGESNGVTNIPSTPVLVQCHEGTITVSGGLTDGTAITVYSTSGMTMGSATTEGGRASVSTSLQAGDVAIVNIGSKQIKVVMK